MLGERTLETLSGQEHRERAQVWLDEEKERAYDEMWALFSKINNEEGPDKLREYLCNLINSNLEETGEKPIDIELFQELDLKLIKSKSASRIAGKKIQRPVLVFRSTDAYKKFDFKMPSSKHLKSYKKVGSLGATFKYGMNSGNGKTVMIQCIFASPDKETINHEIRHTVDPLAHVRKGYDGILSEIFASYWKFIVERWHEGYISLRNLGAHIRGDREDVLWQNFHGFLLATEGYYAYFTDEADKKITYKEYDKLVCKVIAAVKRIQARNNSHIKTQRQLIQLKTLDELFHFAE